MTPQRRQRREGREKKKDREEKKKDRETKKKKLQRRQRTKELAVVHGVLPIGQSQLQSRSYPRSTPVSSASGGRLRRMFSNVLRKGTTPWECSGPVTRVWTPSTPGSCAMGTATVLAACAIPSIPFINDTRAPVATASLAVPQPDIQP